MAQKFIEWTETAIQQRRSILKYWTIRNGSPDYALKIIRLSEQHTESILKNPLTFRKSDFPNTRVAAMGHFSIYYKVKTDRIYITAFWDNRQDPKKLLKILG